MDAGRLAVTVTHADGRTTRWGYDSVDGGTIPNDLTFGTQDPGGFGPMSTSLMRDLNPRPDEGLFDTVRVYGPGNRTAYEGRITQLPRQTGSAATLQPGAVGWSAHLEDDQSFREIYVDRDLSRWTEPPLVRRAAVALGGTGTDQINVSTADTGLAWDLPASLSNGQTGEIMYSAPAGVTIKTLEYRGKRTGTFTGIDAPTLFGGTDPNTLDLSTALTFDDTIHGDSLSSSRRYLLLRVRNASGSTVTPGVGAQQTVQRLAVYGNHGLTLRATVAGYPDGVYASDVVANVVGRAAPLLNYTTGSSGSIQPTTFAIPHLTFPDPTTASDVIAQANTYHNWTWGVWDNKTFYFEPQGSGVEWQARIADGASLSLEGDSADQILTGVIVTYQDGGVSKTAGPVGSGCDVESSSLQDTSSDNPANAHSIPRIKQLPIGFPTTDAGAVQLGAIYLAEQNLASRRGTMTLSGTARHPTEGLVPVWRMRAGDSVILTDQAGSVSRRIISTSYTHSSRTVSLELDSTAHKLDALLARILAIQGTLS